MVRTTTPRPVDVTAQFPELAPLARTAVRLHPRPGAPAAPDSSIGGPLLWPAGEPWPVCAEHTGPWQFGFTPGDVRLRRQILAAAWSRPRAPGTDLLTPPERAVIDRIGSEGRRIPVDGPVPMVPVAQLYASDIPALPRPPGTDLLQVLWCAFDHDPGYLPQTALRWRTAADVTDSLAVAPQPAVIGNDDYLPEPCVLHPETVTEYPAPHELPEDLQEMIFAWEEDRPFTYQYDLAVAPGWKIGGHAPWSFSDPWPMQCTECGSEVRPLLTIEGSEWHDGGGGSWRPAEATGVPDSRSSSIARPTGIEIGRGYSMQLYVCTSSYVHSHLQNMQ
jgi:hypothetical protein